MGVGVDAAGSVVGSAVGVGVGCRCRCGFSGRLWCQGRYGGDRSCCRTTQKQDRHKGYCWNRKSSEFHADCSHNFPELGISLCWKRICYRKMGPSSAK